MIDKSGIRNKQFQLVKRNILGEREVFKLKSRKEKLDNLIFAKRAVELTKNTLEINPLLLHVNDSILLNLPMTLKDRAKYLKQLILSEDEEIVKFSVYYSREILQNNDSTIINEFISQGFIQEFCIILEKFRKNPNLISLWCLIDISFVTSISLELIKDSSFYLIDSLIGLLNHEHIEIVIHSLWLICNLILENDEVRRSVINSDIVNILANLLSRDNSNEFIKHVSMTVALLLKSKTNVSEQQCYILEMILSNIYISNCKEILTNCYWGFSNISEIGNTTILKNIYKLNLLDNIMKTKLYEIKEIKYPIVNIFNKMILFLSDVEIKDLINNGFINMFERLINDKNETVQQTILIGIGNLASKGESYVYYLKDNTNLIETLVSMCKNSNNNIKKWAFIALNNCCINMKYDSIIYLIGLGIFDIFKENLKNRKENHIPSIILESLDYIFEKGEILKEIQRYNNFIQTFDDIGGIDIIRDLENHPSQSVYEESLKLLDKFNLVD